jgi:hypothetical protein
MGLTNYKTMTTKKRLKYELTRRICLRCKSLRRNAPHERAKFSTSVIKQQLDIIFWESVGVGEGRAGADGPELVARTMQWIVIIM